MEGPAPFKRRSSLAGHGFHPRRLIHDSRRSESNKVVLGGKKLHLIARGLKLLQKRNREQRSFQFAP